MPSPIDLIYQQLYGTLPAKDGVAYERLAAAVCKLLEPYGAVFHDKRIRGEFSKSMYQLDVQFQRNDIAVMGEAKDYTIDEKKVGRGDLQKFGGALPELPVDKGVFFSATGYTKPAIQYANAAKNITGKPIDLFVLRPSVEEDVNERISAIRIELYLLRPNFDNAFIAILSEAGKSKFKSLWPDATQVNINISAICDQDGKEVTSIFELSSGKYCKYSEDLVAESWGTFLLPDCYILIEGQLIGIKGIEYKIPHEITFYEIKIDMHGKAVLLIKDIDGTKLDKLITDVDLKTVQFNDENEAILTQSNLRLP
jgi:hypothetical protein